jgi:hypothetical protein
METLNVCLLIFTTLFFHGFNVHDINMIIYLSFKESLHLIINTFILQVGFYSYSSVGDIHLGNISISTAVLVLN